MPFYVMDEGEWKVIPDRVISGGINLDFSQVFDGMREALEEQMKLADKKLFVSFQKASDLGNRLANEAKRKRKRQSQLADNRKARSYHPRTPAILFLGDNLYVRIGKGHYRLDRRSVKEERHDVEIDSKEVEF